MRAGRYNDSCDVGYIAVVCSEVKEIILLQVPSCAFEGTYERVVPFIRSRIGAHRAVTRALLEHPSGHFREKHEGVARFPLRYNSTVNFHRMRPSLTWSYAGEVVHGTT